MKGIEERVDSFAFAQEFTLLRLETRDPDPYSVNLRVTVIDGHLYVDAAPGRRWGQHLSRNPDVRIRLGKTIYPARAIRTDEKAITDRFMTGRQIYRIEPKPLRERGIEP